MPLLKLETNVALSEEKKKSLLPALSKIVAETLGKPEDYVVANERVQRKGGDINVNGEIPIVFSDYGIDNPSGGPASVGDSGTLEFLVVFNKA